MVDRESTRYLPRFHEMRAANLRPGDRMHGQDAPSSVIVNRCGGRFQRRQSSGGTHYQRKPRRWPIRRSRSSGVPAKSGRARLLRNWANSRFGLHYLRDRDGGEVDLSIEAANSDLTAVEVKAAKSVQKGFQGPGAGPRPVRADLQSRGRAPCRPKSAFLRRSPLVAAPGRALGKQNGVGASWEVVFQPRTPGEPDRRCHPSDAQQVAQHLYDAMFVVGGRQVGGLFMDSRVGVGHGERPPRRVQHLEVVQVVGEHDRALRRHA